MAGKRKRPKLREKGSCFVTDIYKPDGKRTTISFGAVGERSEGEIYAAFGQWLDLFNQHPHKVLAFNNPYDAITNIINPRSIVSVGQLHDKYVEWLEAQLAPAQLGVEDNCSKPDEASLADSAGSVNNNAVRQGCSLPDRDFCTRQGVNDNAVLDITFRLHNDRTYLAVLVNFIRPDYRIWADKDAGADLNASDHLGGRINVCGWMDSGPIASGIRSYARLLVVCHQTTLAFLSM